MSPGLLEDFNAKLKDAMKRQDGRELSVLRMVKSRFQLKLAEKGDKTLSDDAARDVIVSYVRQLQKAIPDFEKAGERGIEKLKEIQYEIDYLDPFIPKVKSEEETRELVQAVIADLKANSPQQIGRVMGTIMKSHKGEVDAERVKRIATELLTPPPPAT